MLDTPKKYMSAIFQQKGITINLIKSDCGTIFLGNPGVIYSSIKYHS